MVSTGISPFSRFILSWPTNYSKLFAIRPEVTVDLEQNVADLEITCKSRDNLVACTEQIGLTDSAHAKRSYVSAL